MEEKKNNKIGLFNKNQKGLKINMGRKTTHKF